MDVVLQQAWDSWLQMATIECESDVPIDSSRIWEALGKKPEYSLNWLREWKSVQRFPRADAVCASAICSMTSTCGSPTNASISVIFSLLDDFVTTPNKIHVSEESRLIWMQVIATLCSYDMWGTINLLIPDGSRCLSRRVSLLGHVHIVPNDSSDDSVRFLRFILAIFEGASGKPDLKNACIETLAGVLFISKGSLGKIEWGGAALLYDRLEEWCTKQKHSYIGYRLLSTILTLSPNKLFNTQVAGVMKALCLKYNSSKNDEVRVDSLISICHLMTALFQRNDVVADHLSLELLCEGVFLPTNKKNLSTISIIERTLIRDMLVTMMCGDTEYTTDSVVLSTLSWASGKWMQNDWFFLVLEGIESLFTPGRKDYPHTAFSTEVEKRLSVLNDTASCFQAPRKEIAMKDFKTGYSVFYSKRLEEIIYATQHVHSSGLVQTHALKSLAAMTYSGVSIEHDLMQSVIIKGLIHCDCNFRTTCQNIITLLQTQTSQRSTDALTSILDEITSFLLKLPVETTDTSIVYLLNLVQSLLQRLWECDKDFSQSNIECVCLFFLNSSKIVIRTEAYSLLRLLNDFQLDDDSIYSCIMENQQHLLSVLNFRALKTKEKLAPSNEQNEMNIEVAIMEFTAEKWNLIYAEILRTVMDERRCFVMLFETALVRLSEVSDYMEWSGMLMMLAITSYGIAGQKPELAQFVLSELVNLVLHDGSKNEIVATPKGLKSNDKSRAATFALGNIHWRMNEILVQYFETELSLLPKKCIHSVVTLYRMLCEGIRGEYMILSPRTRAIMLEYISEVFTYTEEHCSAIFISELSRMAHVISRECFLYGEVIESSLRARLLIFCKTHINLQVPNYKTYSRKRNISLTSVRHLLGKQEIDEPPLEKNLWLAMSSLFLGEWFKDDAALSITDLFDWIGNMLMESISIEERDNLSLCLQNFLGSNPDPKIISMALHIALYSSSTIVRERFFMAIGECWILSHLQIPLQDLIVLMIVKLLDADHGVRTMALDMLGVISERFRGAVSGNAYVYSTIMSSRIPETWALSHAKIVKTLAEEYGKHSSYVLKKLWDIGLKQSWHRLLQNSTIWVNHVSEIDKSLAEMLFRISMTENDYSDVVARLWTALAERHGTASVLWLLFDCPNCYEGVGKTKATEVVLDIFRFDMPTSVDFLVDQAACIYTQSEVQNPGKAQLSLSCLVELAYEIVLNEVDSISKLLHIGVLGICNPSFTTDSPIRKLSCDMLVNLVHSLVFRNGIDLSEVSLVDTKYTMDLLMHIKSGTEGITCEELTNTLMTMIKQEPIRASWARSVFSWIEFDPYGSFQLYRALFPHLNLISEGESMEVVSKLVTNLQVYDDIEILVENLKTTTLVIQFAGILPGQVPQVYWTAVELLMAEDLHPEVFIGLLELVDEVFNVLSYSESDHLLAMIEEQRPSIAHTSLQTLALRGLSGESTRNQTWEFLNRLCTNLPAWQSIIEPGLSLDGAILVNLLVQLPWISGYLDEADILPDSVNTAAINSMHMCNNTLKSTTLTSFYQGLLNGSFDSTDRGLEPFVRGILPLIFKAEFDSIVALNWLALMISNVQTCEKHIICSFFQQLLATLDWSHAWVQKYFLKQGSSIISSIASNLDLSIQPEIVGILSVWFTRNSEHVWIQVPDENEVQHHRLVQNQSNDPADEEANMITQTFAGTWAKQRRVGYSDHITRLKEIQGPRPVLADTMAPETSLNSEAKAALSSTSRFLPAFHMSLQNQFNEEQ